MASDIWLRTIPIVRKETRCRHMGYSFRLTARVLLYAPSHRQDDTDHSLCYTSRGALAGTRNSSMGPPHKGSIRWPIAPWANALTTKLHLAPVHGLCYTSRRALVGTGNSLMGCHWERYLRLTWWARPWQARLEGILQPLEQFVLEFADILKTNARSTWTHSMWIRWKQVDNLFLFNDSVYWVSEKDKTHEMVI